MNPRSTAAPRKAPSCMEIRTDDSCLCVDLEIVHRIETLSDWIAVPRAPDGIVGIGEIRGRPTTLIAPRAVVEHAPPSSTTAPSRASLALARNVLLFGEPFDNLALFLPEGAQLQPLSVPSPHSVIVDRKSLRRVMNRLRDAGRAKANGTSP